MKQVHDVAGQKRFYQEGVCAELVAFVEEHCIAESREHDEKGIANKDFRNGEP